MLDQCCVLDGWQSPVSGYADVSVGSVKIKKHRVGKNSTFFAEGVRGYLFYRYTKSISLTCLSIDGVEWMTDNPEFVWSLESFAERSFGNVLVAGLGLGIVVHQLVKNPKVTSITVVEKNRDVIKVVKPLLPKDQRIKIVEADFYRFMQRGLDVNVVIWDLAVIAPGVEINKWELLSIHDYAKRVCGEDVVVFAHGMDRDPVGEKFIEENAKRFSEIKSVLS